MSVKRKKIVERAKEILLDRFEDGTIDSDELLDDVRQSLRIEKIGSVGEEKVPAGPNVLDSDAIIIVEGQGRCPEPSPLRDKKCRCG